MTPLITAPVATTTLGALSVWSDPLFQLLLPIALIVVGILVGGAIVGYVVSAITNGIARVVGKGRRHGGKRRRR